MISPYSDIPAMGDSVHPLIRLWSWVNGGTALTNFSPNEEPIYLAAIQAYGDPNYVVAHAPMSGKWVIPTDYSMHRLDSHNMLKKDSGPFWRVFEEIRKANAVAIHGAGQRSENTLNPPLK